MIAVVAKSLDKLAALIEDTLDISRIERGALAVDYKRFDASLDMIIKPVIKKTLFPLRQQGIRARWIAFFILSIFPPHIPTIDSQLF
jgi:signal transduction histidine kinase